MAGLNKYIIKIIRVWHALNSLNLNKKYENIIVFVFLINQFNDAALLGKNCKLFDAHALKYLNLALSN